LAQEAAEAPFFVFLKTTQKKEERKSQGITKSAHFLFKKQKK
jgi:hypothetical protein